MLADTGSILGHARELLQGLFCNYRLCRRRVPPWLAEGANGFEKAVWAAGP